jgi:serine-type D-Ala-D-Ala carboxypeptidase/endopeptidase (penicillin-binding protein 4)
VRHIDLTDGNPARQRWPTHGTQGEFMLPWATHQSEPLALILREMNKHSNNVTARHLMLSLARGFPLHAASLPGAQASVQAWLRRQGLGDDDIAIDNGSGLSRTERGKPRAMVQLLRQAWVSRESRCFVDSLPVAGVDGTLERRMQHGAAAGRAYLKTGSLLDARALAGYVNGNSGKVYAVAALANHPQAARATPALDAMIEWVAKNG